MNNAIKGQICQRQPGSCRALTMWHGSRLYGDVDSIF
jgi:hypothetical protein